MTPMHRLLARKIPPMAVTTTIAATIVSMRVNARMECRSPLSCPKEEIKHLGAEIRLNERVEATAVM